MSDQFKTDIHPLPSFKTFEAISARIGNNSFSGFVVCLYRLQNGTFQFFDEFQDLVENIVSLHDNLYILGDFNLHLDNSNGNTKKFNEILTCFDPKQHVNFPTHVHDHWLDLLITKPFLIVSNQFFRQQVSRTILRSYQKLTVVRRNGTKKKWIMNRFIQIFSVRI